MSTYNPKYNVLFIHIPKTAGSSIESHELLGRVGVNQGHLPLTFFWLMWDRGSVGLGRWGNIFKFSFVRNPWDRFVSLYFHEKRPKTFKEFALTLTLPVQLNLGNPHGFTPQRDFLCNNNGEILVDFVGRHENLAADWEYVCRRAGYQNTSLPHVRTGLKYEHAYYKEYYDRESWDAVTKLYAKDIEEFGYDDQL